jgi:DNA repair and recombination protein RAD52
MNSKIVFYFKVKAELSDIYDLLKTFSKERSNHKQQIKFLRKITLVAQHCLMNTNFFKDERISISKKLEKNLSPEYLSVRSGFGNTQLTYVEGWAIISLANNIFGFDGWSSEIKFIQQEYCDDQNSKISVGYSCCVRITLKNGTFKEDVGFGSADNQKMKGPAIEKAKKEAATDALKRALRQFGNALGNCCYDKDFLKNVSKVKKAKREDFDSTKLLKRSDFAENETASFDNELFDLHNSMIDKDAK